MKSRARRASSSSRRAAWSPWEQRSSRREKVQSLASCPREEKLSKVRGKRSEDRRFAADKRGVKVPFLY